MPAAQIARHAAGQFSHHHSPFHHSSGSGRPSRGAMRAYLRRCDRQVFRAMAQSQARAEYVKRERVIKDAGEDSNTPAA